MFTFVVPNKLQSHGSAFKLFSLESKGDCLRQFSSPEEANQIVIVAHNPKTIKCKMNGNIGKNSVDIMCPKALKIYQFKLILKLLLKKFYFMGSRLANRKHKLFLKKWAGLVYIFILKQ